MHGVRDAARDDGDESCEADPKEYACCFAPKRKRPQSDQAGGASTAADLADQFDDDFCADGKVMQDAALLLAEACEKLGCASACSVLSPSCMTEVLATSQTQSVAEADDDVSSSDDDIDIEAPLPGEVVNGSSQEGQANGCCKQNQDDESHASHGSLVRTIRKAVGYS